MLRWMDGKSRINLWNWKESGIEKVQVLKGKGKEREEKEREGKAGTSPARQGQGKAGKRQDREISKDRTKERTNLERKEKKRKEVVLARIVFPFFSFPSPFHLYF